MSLKQNKYRNKEISIAGQIFQSKLEAKRYKQLALLEKAGEIKDLKMQVKYELQEAFTKNGKTYRKIEYIADFVYYDNKLKKTIVEDTKGIKTDVFKIKQKMFEKKYPELELRIITKDEVQNNEMPRAIQNSTAEHKTTTARS